MFNWQMDMEAHQQEVAFFTIQSGTLADAQIAIVSEHPAFLIGSDARCNLRLTDPGIGATHAVVTIRDGQVTIKPRYPVTKVFINDRPVTMSAALKVGDMVQIGSVRMLFDCGEAALVAHPAASAVQPTPKPVPHYMPAYARRQPTVTAPSSVPQTPVAASISHPTEHAVYYPTASQQGGMSFSMTGIIALFATVTIIAAAGIFAFNQFNTPAASEYDIYAPGTARIVMFYADWCQYCKQQDPIVRGLDREFGDALNVEFVDVESPANRQLVSQFGAGSIPLTVILDGNGKLQSRWVGLTSARILRRAVERVLEDSQPILQADF